jgi:hypothetical protein
METIRIFIASSAELEADRKAFREMLSVENDRLHYNGVYLELVQWEYFFDALSATSKQDDYNKELKKSSIVICLFYTKAGKYTQEEFDTALKHFSETGTPLIYTYFKEPGQSGAVIKDSPAESEDASLKEFKNRLSGIKHFYTRYKNTEDLKLQFKMQLDMLADNGFAGLQQKIQTQSHAAVTNYINIVLQGITNSTITINVHQALGNSPDYNKLREKKKRCETNLSALQPGQNEVRKNLLEEKTELENDIKLFEETVTNITKQIIEARDNSERVNKAKRFLDQGNILEAQKALNENEIEKDYEGLVLLRQQREKEIEEIDHKMMQIADEYLLKAHFALLNHADDDWRKKAETYFEISLSKFKYYRNLMRYAKFSTQFGNYKRAIELYTDVLGLNDLSAFKKTEAYKYLVKNYLAIKNFQKVPTCLYSLGEINDFETAVEELFGSANKADAMEDSFNVILQFSRNYPEYFTNTKALLVMRKILSNRGPGAFLPLEISTINNITHAYLEIDDKENSLAYFKEAVDKSKSYFITDRLYMTIKEYDFEHERFPNELLYNLASNLLKLSEKSIIEGDRLASYVSDMISMQSEYEKLIEDKDDQLAYVSLFNTFSRLSFIKTKQDLTIEILKKAVELKSRLDITEPLALLLADFSMRLMNYFWDANNLDEANVRLF